MKAQKEKHVENMLRNRKKHLLLQYTAAITTSITAAGFVCAYAWPSPSLPYLTGKKSEFPVSKDQSSWIASLYPVGLIIGYLLNPLFIDRIGRKGTLMMFSLPQIASWLLIILAKNYISLYIARIIGGIGYGGGISSSTVYISEIGDLKNRGVFLVFLKFMMNLGFLFTMILGAFLSYKNMNLVLLMMPLLFFITFIFMPDSSYFWEINKKNEEMMRKLNLLKEEEEKEEFILKKKEEYGTRNCDTSNFWSSICGPKNFSTRKDGTDHYEKNKYETSNLEDNNCGISNIKEKEEVMRKLNPLRDEEEKEEFILKRKEEYGTRNYDTNHFGSSNCGTRNFSRRNNDTDHYEKIKFETSNLEDNSCGISNINDKNGGISNFKEKNDGTSNFQVINSDTSDFQIKNLATSDSEVNNLSTNNFKNKNFETSNFKDSTDKRSCSETMFFNLKENILWKLFAFPSHRRGLEIMLFLGLTNVFSGHAGITTFTQQIFTYKGCFLAPEKATVVLATVTAIVSLISTQFVERIKRKVILLSTGITGAISLALVGTFFFLQEQKIDVGFLDWLPVVGITVYDVMLSCGMGNLYYIYQGELFANTIKSEAISFNKISYMAFSFLFLLKFQNLIDTVGTYISFWLFTVGTILGTFCVYVLTPETKGKSLDEIQMLLKSRQIFI